MTGWAGNYGLRSCRDCGTSFAEYEAMKASWAADHPDATPEEYLAAMRSIADCCEL